jgi:hypothetical protein
MAACSLGMLSRFDLPFDAQAVGEGQDVGVNRKKRACKKTRKKRASAHVNTMG